MQPKASLNPRRAPRLRLLACQNPSSQQPAAPTLHPATQASMRAVNSSARCWTRDACRSRASNAFPHSYVAAFVDRLRCRCRYPPRRKQSSLDQSSLARSNLWTGRPPLPPLLRLSPPRHSWIYLLARFRNVRLQATRSGRSSSRKQDTPTCLRTAAAPRSASRM